MFDLLPAGDYDLQVRTFGSGNNANDAIFRIDRKTGRSWKLEGALADGCRTEMITCCKARCDGRNSTQRRQDAEWQKG